MYLPLNDWGERFLLDGWRGAGDSFVRPLPCGGERYVLVPLDVPQNCPLEWTSSTCRGEPRGAGTRLDVSLKRCSFGDIALEIGARDAGAPDVHRTGRREALAPWK
jgi:hypothetical protein